AFRGLAEAEARQPGRELRAIAWYGAYLAARPGAADAGDIRKTITMLQARHDADADRLLEQTLAMLKAVPGHSEQDLKELQTIADVRKYLGADQANVYLTTINTQYKTMLLQDVAIAQVADGHPELV